MADVDEENPRTFQTSADEVDLSDETVDWRVLGVFSKSEHPTVPRRGEKDFEPDGTKHQDRVLADSRQAMHDALSLERIQPPKSHVRAIWHEYLQRALVAKPRGPHFQTVGKQDSNGNLWLLPEETLWLLERGTVSCWWESSLPMSLQGCYAACLGDASGLTLEHFQVFANLKRTGYTVMRVPSWDSRDADCVTSTAPQQRGLSTWVVGLFRSIFGFAFGPGPSPPGGPLVEPGLWRSYDGIYKRLTLIPYHDPILAGSECVSSKKADPPFRIAYNVWKPRPSFKKSSPGEPDFRVAVINARETSVPTLRQVSALLESVPYDPPPPETQRHSYVRLKHGHRNAILAVVDQGVISYLRLSDAGFGLEKIIKPGYTYERE
ncbi:MAG: tRNA-splicing endonuclease subunit sen54 [Geoglossum umbratile]|nr:MAG: tRNA-splicing endonuclease subunit sen54 [Geoglossum umbratile]